MQPVTLSRLQDDLSAWLQTGDPALTARFGDDAAPGLAVYLNNYRLQLLGCLEEAFPHALRWLGEERFWAAARQHIMSCPPVSWTLDAYPQTFAATIEQHFPDEPVVADLVRLEWAISVAFVAADVAPLTRAQFTDLDWDGVALRQGAGAQFLAQRTNAVAIWSALSRDEAPPAAELLEEVRSVLVWRSEETPFFRTLDADEVEIFASLEQPRRFTAICEALVARIGHEPGIARAGQLLARWADDGAVAVAAGP